MASSYHPSMFGLILSCTKDRTLSLTPLSSSERCSSMFRRSIGSGRAEEPALWSLPALVTAIFSPLSEPHYRPGLFHSAYPHVANTFSGAGCYGWTGLHLAHGEWSEAAAERRQSSRPLAGPGGTLRDDGARCPRRRRVEGGAPGAG